MSLNPSVVINKTGGPVAVGLSSFSTIPMLFNNVLPLKLGQRFTVRYTFQTYTALVHSGFAVPCFYMQLQSSFDSTGLVSPAVNAASLEPTETVPGFAAMHSLGTPFMIDNKGAYFGVGTGQLDFVCPREGLYSLGVLLYVLDISGSSTTMTWMTAVLSSDQKLTAN